MTNAAIQYLILHDKEELEDLMEGIKDEIDAEFMDIVLGIEKLLEESFVEEENSVGKFKDSSIETA